MSFSSKFSSHRGVSGLEYMALAVLLMLGILLGGPYVVRSLNAPFKALEEGAIDSQREEIRQASVQGDVNIPPCSCTDYAFASCGDGLGCGKRQAVFTRSCAPMGCEDELIRLGVIPPIVPECRNDPTNTYGCCDDPVATGNCGVLAANVPGGCPDGEMEYRQVCGSPTGVTLYSCRADSNCVFDCAPQGPNIRGWCNPATYNQGLLGPATPVRTVTFGACGTVSDERCLAECESGFFSNGFDCSASCGNGICEPAFGENSTLCPGDCPPSSPPQCYYPPTNEYWPRGEVLFVGGPSGRCCSFYCCEPEPINIYVCAGGCGAPTQACP